MPNINVNGRDVLCTNEDINTTSSLAEVQMVMKGITPPRLEQQISEREQPLAPGDLNIICAADRVVQSLLTGHTIKRAQWFSGRVVAEESRYKPLTRFTLSYLDDSGKSIDFDVYSGKTERVDVEEKMIIVAPAQK
jgi:hypothetical protein